jgi:hypothetical protein
MNNKIFNQWVLNKYAQDSKFLGDYEAKINTKEPLINLFKPSF